MSFLNHIIAALILTICASTANGQWKFIGEDPDEDIRYFLDTSRIKHDKTRIWVWYLLDHKEPKTEAWGTYQSMELEEEINCDTREKIYLDYIYYAEPGGRGKVIDSNSTVGIGPVRVKPGTFFEKLMDAACDQFGKLLVKAGQF